MGMGGSGSCLWDDCDGAISRQTFGFGALFRVNTFANFTAEIRQRKPISVLYIYCTIPNRAEILFSVMFSSDSSLLSWKGM